MHFRENKRWKGLEWPERFKSSFYLTLYHFLVGICLFHKLRMPQSVLHEPPKSNQQLVNQGIEVGHKGRKLGDLNLSKPFQ